MSQIKENLYLEPLGLLPTIDSVKKLGIKKQKEMSADPNDRQASIRDPLLRFAIDNPQSIYAETLLSVKLASDVALEGRKSKVIGVVSSFASEGKSAFATNFAAFLADMGVNTLLVDGDLRNPTCSRNLVPIGSPGYVDAILEKASMKDFVRVDPETNLFVLPGSMRKKVTHATEILSSAGFADVMDEASEVFDYIIVDLPPLGPVVDARAASNQVDAFVHVVEWGKTPRYLVRSVLNDNETIVEKCLGVVLNKVDMASLKMYAQPDEVDRYYGPKYGYAYQKTK